MAKKKPEHLLGEFVKDKISYSMGIVIAITEHFEGRYTYTVQPRQNGPRLDPWEAEEHQLVMFSDGDFGESYDPESLKF